MNSLSVSVIPVCLFLYIPSVYVLVAIEKNLEMYNFVT